MHISDIPSQFCNFTRIENFHPLLLAFCLNHPQSPAFCLIDTSCSDVSFHKKKIRKLPNLSKYYQISYVYLMIYQFST